MRGWLLFVIGWLGLGIASASAQSPLPKVDLSGYRDDCGVSVKQEGARLHIAWPMVAKEQGSVILNLAAGEPLIEQLGIATVGKAATPIITSVDPVTHLTIGERDLKEQGWNVFFDNPPRKPHETFLVTLEKKSVRVSSQGKRCTIAIDGARAGSFKGEVQFTVYPGCRLVHQETVVSTERDACAILYATGFDSPKPSWKSVAWLDTKDKLQREELNPRTAAKTLGVRHRAIVAEGASGSVTTFAPPHQFLYPLDLAENYELVWHGRGFMKSGDSVGVGIRQPPQGDGRYVPWVNAPPGTKQRLGVFYHLSSGQAEAALKQVQPFTHGDRYEKLPGYRTFTSHYHIEHTLDYLQKQREQKTTGIPAGLEQPPFVKAFQDRGVEIVHLAEFHVGHTPDFITQRLPQLERMHEECRRLSNDSFLLLPGEEPNVQLGGHWISLFPKPVYWLLHPAKEVPFEQKIEGLPTVYAVHNADEMLKLMEKEGGLMWTAHPRTKGSFGFPDRYRDKNFYKSDRFLGAAWKAMPSDLSQPRLGKRSLDLLDDMANWGEKKYVLGEVDVFKVMPEYELYGHMNINYLKLDKIPRYDDGWQPVVDALRGGKFFVSTGEVLLPEFRVQGEESGATCRLSAAGEAEIAAKVHWTFPPSFAEVIWGDGTKVYRHSIGLADEAAFGSRDLRVKLPMRGAKWVRLEAWDVAANGAFTQPVWVE